MSKDKLTILSSEGGAEGVVIRGGQAMISVVEVHKSKNSGLRQLMDLYDAGITVLARKHIHNKAARPGECRDLYEVISKEPVVPPGSIPGRPPNFVNTEFFCQIGRIRYVTVLRNFEGDTKQRMYQQVALQVAESLRAGQQGKEP